MTHNWTLMLMQGANESKENVTNGATFPITPGATAGQSVFAGWEG